MLQKVECPTYYANSYDCWPPDFDSDDPEIAAKRAEIEECLKNLDAVSLEELEELANSKGGLISGNKWMHPIIY